MLSYIVTNKYWPMQKYQEGRLLYTLSFVARTAGNIM
jgi:hypothetical protein